jgi:diamine N-acetyltransferase
MTAVSLREINRHNVRSVCELQVADDQRTLVAPASYTVAESAYETDGFLRAVYADDAPVGVVFVGLDEATPYIVRFMVDAAHQRQGIGRAAVTLVIAELERQGRRSVEVSFVPAENGAEGFWRRCGFEDTGRVHEGERVFVRQLDA